MLCSGSVRRRMLNTLLLQGVAEVRGAAEARAGSGQQPDTLLRRESLTLSQSVAAEREGPLPQQSETLAAIRYLTRLLLMAAVAAVLLPPQPPETVLPEVLAEVAAAQALQLERAVAERRDKEITAAMVRLGQPIMRVAAAAAQAPQVVRATEPMGLAAMAETELHPASVERL